MTTTDRILNVIDAGLQSSGEHGYGEHAPEGMCARCAHHEPPDGGDLCPGCRAFLLEDSDVDPSLAPTAITTTPAPQLTAEQMQAMVDHIATAAAEAIQAAGRAIKAFSDTVCAHYGVDTLEEAVACFRGAMPTEAPAHRLRERQLIDQHRRSHRCMNRWGPQPGRR